jgi:hypothetical protein
MISPYALVHAVAAWDDYRGIITKCEWDADRQDYAYTIMAVRDGAIGPARPHVKLVGEFQVKH